MAYHEKHVWPARNWLGPWADGGQLGIADRPGAADSSTGENKVPPIGVRYLGSVLFPLQRRKNQVGKPVAGDRSACPRSTWPTSAAYDAGGDAGS